MREEVAQEVTQLWSEVVIETGAEDGLIGGCLVDSLERGDRAGFAVDGEKQDERPDEHCDVDLSMTLDGIARDRDAFDWKEQSQPASYECRREFS